MFPHYWLATVFVLQAVLVSLPGFSLTSRPLKSLLHTRFFCSCEQLHPLSQQLSCHFLLLMCPTRFQQTWQMSSASFNRFIICKQRHEEQSQLDVTLCILPYFCSVVKYKTQRNFYKLSHYIFILCLICGCFLFVCVFVYLVPLCPWMDRRILPIC